MKVDQELCVVRKSTKREIPRLIKIFRKAVLSISEKYYKTNQLLVWADSLTDDILEGLMRNEVLLSGYYSGCLAGFSILRRDGYLAFLYVDPDYQGRGIGEKLLNCTEDWAREHLLSGIFLDASLNALGFYCHHQYSLKSRTVMVRDRKPFLCWRMEKSLNVD